MFLYQWGIVLHRCIIYFHCKLLHRVFSILPIEEIKFIRYRVFLAMFIPRKFQKPRNFSFSCQLYNRGNKPRKQTEENKLFLRDHLRKNGKIVTLRYLHER